MAALKQRRLLSPLAHTHTHTHILSLSPTQSSVCAIHITTLLQTSAVWRISCLPASKRLCRHMVPIRRQSDGVSIPDWNTIQAVDDRVDPYALALRQLA